MANLQVRVDDSLRDEAQKIAHDLGMDLTTAVRVFLKQLVQDRRLPFQPSLDPFYGSENQKALATSIAQLDSGKLIRKTLRDLQAMVDER